MRYFYVLCYFSLLLDYIRLIFKWLQISIDILCDLAIYIATNCIKLLFYFLQRRVYLLTLLKMLWSSIRDGASWSAIARKSCGYIIWKTLKTIQNRLKLIIWGWINSDNLSMFKLKSYKPKTRIKDNFSNSKA